MGRSLGDCESSVQGGELWVSLPETTVGLYRRVVNCILYVFKFKSYTESRWATIGASCRSLTAALSIGLEVVAARARNSSCEYYIHGFFDKLDTDIKKFVCAASIVSWVPEGLVYELVEDDRVARNFHKLRDTLLDDLLYVERLSPQVWSRLAGIFQSKGHAAEIKSECILSAHIAACFIVRRVFSVVQSPPWSLTIWDIHQNLAELVHGGLQPGAHPAVRKIIELQAMGAGLSMIGC